MYFIILSLAAILTLGACDEPKSVAPGEISKAADKAVEQFTQGKLPMGKNAFGEDAAVFGRHFVPANQAINAPEYTVEYLISVNTIYGTPSLTISRRYDQGAGNYLQLSRGKDGRWGINGYGNFQTNMVEDVDTEDGDHDRRKKYMMEIFKAATACAEKKSC